MDGIIPNAVAILKGTESQPENLTLRGNGVLCRHGDMVCLLTVFHVINEIFERNLPKQEEVLQVLNKECVCKHLTGEGVKAISLRFDECHLSESTDLAILRLTPQLSAYLKYGLSVLQALPDDSQTLWIYGFDKDRPIESGFEPIECHFLKKHQNYTRLEFTQGMVYQGYSGSPIIYEGNIIGLLKQIEGTGGVSPRSYPIAKIVSWSVINSGLQNGLGIALDSPKQREQQTNKGFQLSQIADRENEIGREFMRNGYATGDSSFFIKAEQHFRKAHEYLPNNPHYELNVADCLFAQGKNKEAILYYKKASQNLDQDSGHLAGVKRRWDNEITKLTSERQENLLIQKSQPFTSKIIADLAQSCIDNFLTRETAQFALHKIGINPALIQNSPDDRTYFSNIVQYLSSRGQVEAWLIELSKEGLKFAQEWLEKLERVSK